MLHVIWQILPILLSVMSSPIALLAVLAMMASSRPRANCLAYAAGWIASTAGTLAVSLVVLDAVGITGSHANSVVLRSIHAALAIVLFAGAWWSYQKAQASMQRVAAARTPAELAAATPQLPGILDDSTEYTPGRALSIGSAVFLFNPTSICLVIATAIDLLLGDLSGWQMLTLCIAFVLAASLPVVAPVLIVWTRDTTRTTQIAKIRDWTLHHHGFVRAGLLMLVGFLQATRALDGGLL